MKKNITKINLIFYFSIIFFITTCYYVLNNQKATSAMSTGQVGGRQGLIIQAGTCGCPGTPPTPPCPHMCACGMNDVAIIPAGFSAPAICPPPGMLTNGPPVIPGSTGNQILGMFSQVFPIAIPMGIIGTSF